VTFLGRRNIEKDIIAIDALMGQATSTSFVARPVHNVVNDYGATGDGATDDYQAIQDALDAVPAGGGTVYIPSNATYIVGTTLQIDNNTHVIGGGWGTVLKMKDNANLNTGILASDTKDSITIANLALDGNKANQTNNNLQGIRHSNSTNLVVDNIYCIDFKGTTGAGNEAAAINIRGSSEYEARASVINCIAIGGGHIAAFRAGAVMFANCLVKNNTDIGFGMSGSTTTSRRSAITNCVAYNNGQCGFNLENQSNTIVSNCVSTGNDVDASPLGGFRVQNGNNIIFSGCLSKSDDIGFTTTGSATGQPTQVAIIGCTVDTPAAQGIDLTAEATATSYYKVQDCTIVGATQGIAVDANVLGVTITGNTVTNCSANGINCLHKSYAVITDNLCRNNTSSGIRVSSTTGSAVVVGNHCTNNGLHGIGITSIADERGATVAGNVCLNNSQTTGDTSDGILLTSCNATAVVGNTCTDDQVTATQRYGIAEVGTCDYITYTGNVFRGNATGALLESGANNKVASNIGVADAAVVDDITAGTGLTGGGTGSVTINAIGGDGITANADDLAVNLKATSGLEVDGTGVAIADSVAGAGLTIASKVLAVGAGTGITVNADDVALAATAAGGGLTHSAGVLAVGAGDGITVNANDVALASGAAGTGLAYASGVLSVNTATGITTSGDNVIHATGDNGDLHTNYPEHDQTESITGAWTFDNTGGIVIDQAAGDGEILALLSSDVAHTYTGVTTADTYGQFLKRSAANGGLELTGFTEGSIALELRGAATTDLTAKTTGVGGAVILEGTKVSANNYGAMGTNANLVVIRNNGTTRFIFDAEGEAHADENFSGTFDAYDDVQLVRALDIARGGESVIRSEFDQWLKYNVTDLEQAGILHPEENGRRMINITRLRQLHNGAIWQLGMRIQQLEERLAQHERPN
jgi:hypothetical protein